MLDKTLKAARVCGGRLSVVSGYYTRGSNFDGIFYLPVGTEGCHGEM